MNFDETYLMQMGVLYLFTIAIETPVLMVMLSKRHSIGNRIFAGIWLSACTYPFVWLVFPILINPLAHRGLYLAVAETFAPVAECVLFWLAFDKTRSKPNGVIIDDDDDFRADDPRPGQKGDSDATGKLARNKAVTWRELGRDMGAIVLANLASFGVGVLVGEEFWKWISGFF